MCFSDKGEFWPRRPPLWGVLGIGLAIFVFGLAALGQESATADEVKAAYLFNFAKLAEWPRRALPDGPSALVIGVWGGDEKFLAAFREIVAGKVVGTHPVSVRALGSEDDMKSCQMIFFRASEKQHAQAALERLAQSGVLLVGEDESFLRQGGMINLVRDHGSVRFEVNPDALDRSEIHFSSRILALAKAGNGPSRAAASNAPVEETRRLERGAPPEYPELAKRMNLTGAAQVQALVEPDGSVKEVKVIGGHPVLADALARAVRHWKYQPAPKETVEGVKFSFGP